MLVSALHLLTDTRHGRDPLPDVEAALAAGVDWVQVRAKDVPDREALDLVRRVVDRARAYSATVVVDDRADIALAAGAHGVHVGDRDLPVADVRRLLGAGAVVGATARSPLAARAAVDAGADYVGVGPVFGTATKTGLPSLLGVHGVAAVAAAVDAPVVAIGGVGADDVGDLRRAGAHGVAVVSAVADAPEPAAACAALLAALDAQPTFAGETTLAGDPTRNTDPTRDTDAAPA